MSMADRRLLMYVSDSRELANANARFKSTWGDLTGKPPEMPFAGVCLTDVCVCGTSVAFNCEHSMPFDPCSAIYARHDHEQK